MAIEQQREELLRRISELKELQTTEFPERNVVHLGLNFFADVDKDKAQEMIQKRLNRMEAMYASVCQLSGVNEEGLPVFDIVEELDDDDNVVKATVNRTGWPANDASQSQINQSQTNQTNEKNEQEKESKQEKITELPATATTPSEGGNVAEKTQTTAVNKPQTTKSANSGNTKNTKNTENFGLSKQNPSAAINDEKESAEVSNTANTNCHSERPDNSQETNPASSIHAEPLPDFPKTTDNNDTNGNKDGNQLKEKTKNTADGHDNAIANTDVTENPANPASAALNPAAEDASQGEYRDIDPSDLLELELSENDIDYDFDDIEEQSEGSEELEDAEEAEGSEEETDDEQRYSLFPESTLKLIEAHLASQNLLDDPDLSDLGEVDVEVPRIKEILGSVDEEVETKETNDDDEMEEDEEIGESKPVEIVQDVVKDITEKVQDTDKVQDTVEPEKVEVVTEITEKSEEFEPKSEKVEVVKDITEKVEAEVEESEKKAVKFSEKVDVKEFQIDRREHKQMPKVSKFKQARAMETQRNSSTKAATAAAIAASRMKPATKAPPKNLKSIMKKPVKRPQVQPQKPASPQKAVQKSTQLQKPPASVKKPASPPKTKSKQTPQPEQLEQLESQHKQQKIEKDTEQFIAESYLPDKDFLALHDEDVNDDKPVENKSPNETTTPASTADKKPAAKSKPVVADKLVERINPEPKNDEFTDMAEVKARYQQLKQRMVYANGNYVAKENAVEPLQKRKVSRFKAARP